MPSAYLPLVSIWYAHFGLERLISRVACVAGAGKRKGERKNEGARARRCREAVSGRGGG